MTSTWLTTAQWLAVLRIGLGLWWIKSFLHKDLGAWLTRGAGIAWGGSVAEKHKWAFVKTGFDKMVRPHPIPMAYVVVFSELDRPRFGRHVLTLVIDVSISGWMISICRSERPRAALSSLTCLWRGLSG